VRSRVSFRTLGTRHSGSVAHRSPSETAEANRSERGTAAEIETFRTRRGTGFDPTLVAQLESIDRDYGWWARLADTERIGESVVVLERGRILMVATDERLDCVAFAAAVHAQPKCDARYSIHVARYAVAIAEIRGVDRADCRDVPRAGLLRESGKRGVSNCIQDKPAKWTEVEFAEVRKEPAWTREMLDHVAVFRHVAPDAAVIKNGSMAAVIRPALPVSNARAPRAYRRSPMCTRRSPRRNRLAKDSPWPLTAATGYAIVERHSIARSSTLPWCSLKAARSPPSPS
jgi:hypothetical protein